MLTLSDAMKLCLISDTEPVRAAVRASCLPPHEVAIFGLEGFLKPDHTLSDYGKSVVEAAQQADAVLIGWSLQQAPLINAVSFAVSSKEAFVPVIALCSGGQEEMIAALAAGVDDVASFPLYLPLFQARMVAHRRVVNAARRAAAERVKKKIQDKREKTTVERVEAEVEKMAGTLVGQVMKGLEEHLQDKAGGDGLASKGKQVTDAVGTQVGIFAGELLENVVETLVEEVDGELVLLNPDHDVVQVSTLRLDWTAYRMYVGDDEVELTPKEFELLGFLMKHAGELCTRDQILDQVWSIDFETGTNMVDVYMHFLRKKLAAHGLGDALQTVRGRGYRLTIEEIQTA